MTSIKVQLFAVARELAGTDVVVIDVDKPPTVAELQELVAVACPALRPWVEHCRVAVDHVYVDNQVRISHEQDVALIPPVSGG